MEVNGGKSALVGEVLQRHEHSTGEEVRGDNILRPVRRVRSASIEEIHGCFDRVDNYDRLAGGIEVYKVSYNSCLKFRVVTRSRSGGVMSKEGTRR